MRRTASVITTALIAALLSYAAPAHAAEDDDPYFFIHGETARKFYPTVEDGYLDTYEVNALGSFAVSEVSATITNDATGVVVSTMKPYAESPNPNHIHYEWDGTDDAGDKVPTGSYTLRMDVVDDGNDPHSLTRNLTVARAVKTLNWNRSLAGNGGDVVTSGPCAAKTVGQSSLYLHCDNASRKSFASASYAFNIPRSATRLEWGTTTRSTCCKGGTYTAEGERATSRGYIVTLTVTRNRGREIEDVFLSYRARTTV